MRKALEIEASQNTGRQEPEITSAHCWAGLEMLKTDQYIYLYPSRVQMIILFKASAFIVNNRGE